MAENPVIQERVKEILQLFDNIPESAESARWHHSLKSRMAKSTSGRFSQKGIITSLIAFLLLANIIILANFSTRQTLPARATTLKQISNELLVTEPASN